MSVSLRLRASTRAAVLVALVASMVAVTAPAQAASWTRVGGTDRAQVQVCQVPVSGGKVLRLRLDNRRASHWHRATIWVNGRTAMTTRVAAGRVGAVQSTRIQTPTRVGYGIEDSGGALGSDFAWHKVGRC